MRDYYINIPIAAPSELENSDVSFTQSIPSGDTYVLDNYEFEFQDPNGVVISTEIRPAMYGQSFSFPTGFGADAILQRNATQIKTIASAATFNLKTKLDGIDEDGVWDGVDTLDFTSSSVLLTVSDLTPEYGVAISLTASPTSITPTTYIFFTFDGTTISPIVQQAGATYTWTCNRIGSYDIYVNATDDVNSVFSKVSVVGGYDTDVAAFLTATAITDTTIINAIDTLVRSLKGFSLWTKLYSIYPFVGGTATTHKYNLKNPVDTDGGFRIIFNGGWTHNSMGITPNGSNGYADTRFNYAVQSNINDFHVGFYININNNLNVDYGCDGASANFYMSAYSATLSGGRFYFDGSAILFTDTDSLGHYTGSRIANNNTKVFKNKVQVGTSAATNSSGFQSGFAYLGALNRNGSASFFGVKRYAFLHNGVGLTFAENEQLYDTIQAFQVALGRQV